MGTAKDGCVVHRKLHRVWKDSFVKKSQRIMEVNSAATAKPEAVPSASSDQRMHSQRARNAKSCGREEDCHWQSENSSTARALTLGTLNDSLKKPIDGPGSIAIQSFVRCRGPRALPSSTESYGASESTHMPFAS